MFRSVKNWLTILILALVALAMIVAWAYVVPPLANRLDQQKLVDQKSTAQLINTTVEFYLRYDLATASLYVYGNDSSGFRIALEVLRLSLIHISAPTRLGMSS